MAEQTHAPEMTTTAKESKLDPIKGLIEKGKEAGYLTYEEINRKLPEGVIGGEELDELFGTLEDMGIEVVDREEDLLRPTDKAPEEEVPLPDIGVKPPIPSVCTSPKWAKCRCSRASRNSP